jgi:hypothetical protein
MWRTFSLMKVVLPNATGGVLGLLCGQAILLLLSGLQTLTNLDAGFRPENVLLLTVQTLKAGPQGVERVRLYERVLDRLSRVPGVRSAALSSESLFSGNMWTESR